MDDQEHFNFINEKTIELGKSLEGIELNDVLWILNRCLYAAMHQMMNPPKPK